MKKAIVGVVLVAVLFLGYRQYDKSAAPAKRYRAFAEEVLKRHYDAAAAMSDGLTAAHPAGVESAVRPAMSATLHQVATLRKVAGEWKITAFENKFEKMESLTTR